MSDVLLSSDVTAFSDCGERHFIAKASAIANLCGFVESSYNEAVKRHGEVGAWDIEYFRNYARLSASHSENGVVKIVEEKKLSIVRMSDSRFVRRKRRVLVILHNMCNFQFSIDGFRQ